MKKRLSIITDEQGVFLPYVLFVTAICLIVIMTNINTYSNEIQFTENHIIQLKMETLVQMGREKFKEDYEANIPSGLVSYLFPPGRVKIDYFKLNTSEVRLNFTVYIAKKTYQIVNILNLNSA